LKAYLGESISDPKVYGGGYDLFRGI
jgi:hypothetical protein